MTAEEIVIKVKNNFTGLEEAKDIIAAACAEAVSKVAKDADNCDRCYEKGFAEARERAAKEVESLSLIPGIQMGTGSYGIRKAVETIRALKSTPAGQEKAS